MTALSAAVLAVLIAGPALHRLGRAPRLRQHALTGRRAPRSPQDYASLLDAISRQVRSGTSLASAVLDEIDPNGPLGDVVDRVDAGSSLADALAAITPRQADAALTVQALSAAAHLGGPIAATLDEAAAVLRERAAARAERRAHASQARLSARVLTIVPIGFAAWGALASHRTRDAYLSTMAGGICAVCGLLLNVVGWRWMKRIIGPT